MPKKNNKKSKEKPIHPTRSLEERTQFVENIKDQFIKLGCYPGVFEATNTFFKILDDYQNEGCSASGKINFPECPHGGRVIVYLLSNRPTVENVVHFLSKDRQNK